MAFENQIQTSAIWNLCKINRHEIPSCIVTKSLFKRFEIHLTSILPETLDEKEIALGLEIDQKEVR